MHPQGYMTGFRSEGLLGISMSCCSLPYLPKGGSTPYLTGVSLSKSNQLGLTLRVPVSIASSFPCTAKHL